MINSMDTDIDALSIQELLISIPNMVILNRIVMISFSFSFKDFYWEFLDSYVHEDVH